MREIREQRRTRAAACGMRVAAAALLCGVGVGHAGSRWIESLYSAQVGKATAVCLSKDGGCVLTGYVEDSQRRNLLFLARLARDGTVSWQKSLAPRSGGRPVGISIQETVDRGVIVLAQGATTGGDWDLLLLKLDAQGNIKWQKLFGGAGEDYAGEVQRTVDGGYLVVGSTGSFLDDYQYGYYVWLVKLDNTGAITWQKRYGLPGEDVFARSAQQTRDGGYVVAGTRRSHPTFGYDPFMVKLDSAGAIAWQVGIGVAEAETYSGFECVRQAADGGYVAVGSTDEYGSGKGDSWVVKFDTTGEVLWQKAIGSPRPDWANDLVALKDGSCVVAGMVSSPNRGGDGWLCKLDPNGNIVWQRVTGGGGGEIFNAVQTAPDGGFFVAGSSESFGPGFPNILIAKYNKNGRISSGCAYNTDATAVAVDTSAVAFSLGLVAADTFAQADLATMSAVDATTTVTAVCGSTRERAPTRQTPEASK